MAPQLAILYKAWPRRCRPRVEGLEGRLAPSAAPLLAAADFHLPMLLHLRTEPHPAVADFNGDSLLDHVSLGPGPGQAQVLLGQAGSPSFVAGQTLSVPLVNPNYVAAVDANNDGLTDLIFSSAEDGRLATLLGRGDGTFADSEASLVKLEAGALSTVRIYSATLGLGRDGDGQLVAFNPSTGRGKPLWVVPTLVRADYLLPRGAPDLPSSGPADTPHQPSPGPAARHFPERSGSTQTQTALEVGPAGLLPAGVPPPARLLSANDPVPAVLAALGAGPGRPFALAESRRLEAEGGPPAQRPVALPPQVTLTRAVGGSAALSGSSGAFPPDAPLPTLPVERPPVLLVEAATPHDRAAPPARRGPGSPAPTGTGTAPAAAAHYLSEPAGVLLPLLLLLTASSAEEKNNLQLR